MKTILFLLFAIALQASEPITITVTPSQEEEPVQKEIQAPSVSDKKLLIMVSSDEVEKAGMGYALGLSAVNKGIDTTIVIGAKALKSALVKGKQNIFLAKELTHREILLKAIDKGATVMICSMCAQALGLEEKDFIKGVSIVKSAKIFEKMYLGETKVLSF